MPRGSAFPAIDSGLRAAQWGWGQPGSTWSPPWPPLCAAVLSCLGAVAHYRVLPLPWITPRSHSVSFSSLPISLVISIYFLLEGQHHGRSTFLITQFMLSGSSVFYVIITKPSLDSAQAKENPSRHHALPGCLWDGSFPADPARSPGPSHSWPSTTSLPVCLPCPFAWIFADFLGHMLQKLPEERCVGRVFLWDGAYLRVAFNVTPARSPVLKSLPLCFGHMAPVAFQLLLLWALMQFSFIILF